MTNPEKLLLIILDGVPYRNFRRLFGNLEGWVASGEARVRRMRSVLPSTSSACYASMHTGLPPHVHGVFGNKHRQRLEVPDVFSELAGAGRKTGAVALSWWSELFQRMPFDPVRDIELDSPQGPIHHGRFHTMADATDANQMSPSDADLFATLTYLCEAKGIDYGLLHSSTLDSMGHRFGHGKREMSDACYYLDAALAPYVTRWRNLGYDVIVTADHGQDNLGHHGGAGEDQQDVAFYYFGNSSLPPEDTLLDQLALAPSVLTRMGVPVPTGMTAEPFLARERCKSVP
jgi:predicted AlkP superfamily pyrophosphatase or phosphodiesterase